MLVKIWGKASQVNYSTSWSVFRNRRVDTYDRLHPNTKRVILLLFSACRSSVKGNMAIEKIKEEMPNAKGINVVLFCFWKLENYSYSYSFWFQLIFFFLAVFMKLDLSSLTSVKEFVAAFKHTDLPLHILINNGNLDLKNKIHTCT